jgi:hypothetical protein
MKVRLRASHYAILPGFLPGREKSIHLEDRIVTKRCEAKVWEALYNRVYTPSIIKCAV